MTEDPQHKQPRSAWEEAEAEGFDMSLIECNLEKTIWERMINHDRALSLALELRKATQERNGQP
jgi:hypothetical protein